MGEDPSTGGTTVSGSDDPGMAAPAATGSAATGSGDPEEIRQEIEETREQLGETVEALAAKTDVKRQVKRKLDETKASVADKKDEAFGKARETSPEGARTAAVQVTEKARQNPVPLAVIGAFAAGVLAGRIGSKGR